jgi:lipid-A-disaccharide synthase
LLPGSRRQEFEANLSSLVRAAVEIEKQVPDARFVVSALHRRHADRMKAELRGSLAACQPRHLVVEAGKTATLIPQAAAAISVSGSVSLELLAARVPTVIVYSINPLAYVIQSWLRHSRAFTLVNLLAIADPIGPLQPVWWPPRTLAPADPEMLFPEYLAVQDPAPAAARHVIEWLNEPASRQRIVAALDELATVVAQPGSAERAAVAVLDIAARNVPEAGATGGVQPAERAA